MPFPKFFFHTRPPKAGPLSEKSLPLESYWTGKTLLHFKNRNGTIDHYYHFLFGFFFPLVDFLDAHPGEVLVRDAGPLTRLLLDYDDPRIHFLPYALHQSLRQAKNRHPDRVTLEGYDHRDFYNKDVFLKVRKIILRKMEAYQEILEDKYPGLPDKPYVLFINRGLALPYYREARTGGGVPSAGRGRRHIPTIAELFAELQSCYPAYLVELESMPFWEQIYLFRHARIVIGQHGAGLGNLIWTEKCHALLEITGLKREQKLNFQALAGLLDIPHEEIATGTEYPLLQLPDLLPPIKRHWNRTVCPA